MYFPSNGQETMSGTLKMTKIKGQFFQEIKLKNINIFSTYVRRHEAENSRYLLK
jgi:hypothetical protein